MQAEFDALIHSGHSRVPIHVPGDRTQVVGAGWLSSGLVGLVVGMVG